MSVARVNEEDAAAALAGVCAARLHGQGALAQLSLVFTGIAFLALFLTRGWASGAAFACLGAAVLAGLVERYLAVRLVIDARLFDDLARGSMPSLDALDQALSQLQLVPADKAGRSLALRTEGAMRLVRWHTRAAGAQLMLLAAAGIAATQGAHP
jgi:hypothetical protein